MTERIRVVSDGPTGVGSKVYVGDREVSEYLTGLTIEMSIKDANRVTVEALALAGVEAEADAEVATRVHIHDWKNGEHYTGAGHDVLSAVRDLLARAEP
jgi:hypothetical protein